MKKAIFAFCLVLSGCGSINDKLTAHFLDEIEAAKQDKQNFAQQANQVITQCNQEKESLKTAKDELEKQRASSKKETAKPGPKKEGEKK